MTDVITDVIRRSDKILIEVTAIAVIGILHKLMRSAQCGRNAGDFRDVCLNNHCLEGLLDAFLYDALDSR